MLIVAGEFTLEFTNAKLTINGQEVPLTPMEFQIVKLLASRRGEIVTKKDLIGVLYGGFDEPEVQIVDVFASRARNIMRPATGQHNFIEPVWGRGYRFREPPAATVSL